MKRLVVNNLAAETRKTAWYSNRQVTPASIFRPDVVIMQYSSLFPCNILVKIC